MKSFNQFINENNEQIITINNNGVVINDKYLFKGDKVWLKDGKFHRENGPAIETDDGNKHWYINGIRHRENGPAIEYLGAEREWRINGKRHREDGPAIENDEGHKEWWINDKLHRLNGPAIEYADGRKEWHITGKIINHWGEPEIKLLIANNNLKNIIKHREIREKLKEFKYLLSPKDRLLLDVEWDKKI